TAQNGATIGVAGESFSSGGTGVRAWASGGGTGLYGFSGPVFPVGKAPRNVGVEGSAPSGHGGGFSGGKAQVRLVPSKDATHPASGLPGDLFLDKHSRLWLCKDGTTWKQVA